MFLSVDLVEAMAVEKFLVTRDSRSNCGCKLSLNIDLSFIERSDR